MGRATGNPILRAKTGCGRQRKLGDSRGQLSPPYLPSGLWEEKDGGVTEESSAPNRSPASAPAPQVFQGKGRSCRQGGAPSTGSQEAGFQALLCCVTWASSRPPSPDL